MRIGRVIRDLAVLAIVAGVFLLVVQAASLFGSPEKTKSGASIYSEERQSADELITTGKHAEALPYLSVLIERDPFNSYAIYWKSFCSFQAYQKGNAAEGTDLETFLADAESGFFDLLDYPYYENISRFYLGLIYATQDEDEKVFEVLEDAVDNGFYSRQGLAKYEGFKKYRERDEFLEICKKERRNQYNYRRHRQGNVRFGTG